MNELTKTQAEVLKFIKRLVKERGFPPTRKEICKHMGYASGTAAVSHLLALERKGAIALVHNTARGITVLD